MGRAYSCWMLNFLCITWPVGFRRLKVLVIMFPFQPVSVEDRFRCKKYLSKSRYLIYHFFFLIFCTTYFFCCSKLPMQIYSLWNLDFIKYKFLSLYQGSSNQVLCKNIRSKKVLNCARVAWRVIDGSPEAETVFARNEPDSPITVRQPTTSHPALLIYQEPSRFFGS